MKAFITEKDFESYGGQETLWLYKNAAGQTVKIERINESTIEFTCNYMAAPRIIFSHKDDKFIYSVENVEIVNFVENNFEDPKREVTEEPYVNFKERVKKDYEINHVDYIENWSKVQVSNDGEIISKIDYPMQPYTLDLKDAYDNVKKLLLKYKKVVGELIDQHLFIPTLTGGLDTRTLTALYRDRADEIGMYYMKHIKNDGKNHVELGIADHKQSVIVGNRLGLDSYTESFSGLHTLSGMYSEANRHMFGLEPNDDTFIFKFIQHQIRSEKMLFPFSDDLFLQIRQPGVYVCRALLALLLCPDLLDIPLIGTQHTYEKYNKQPYDFYEEYADYLDEARAIMEYWGEDKCKHILDDDEDEQEN